MIQENLVHKIRLRPTPEQEEDLKRCCAASRNAFNFGKEILDKEYDLRKEFYKMGLLHLRKSFTPARVLKKIYNQFKPDWVRGTGTATQEAFEDLNKAIARYLDIKKGKIKLPPPKKTKDGRLKLRKDGRDRGWLTWRSIKKHMSFRQIYQGLKVENKHIQYSKNCGWIRMCEEFRFPFNHPDDKIMRATFSFDGLFWYAAIAARVHIEQPIHPNPEKSVGVDLGIRYLATTSDDRPPAENPRAFYQAQQKLRCLQRKLDRMRRANNPDNYDEKGRVKKGCKWIESNRMKAIDYKIKKLHKRIANIRENASHQLTTMITNEYGIISLEDLNVDGMKRNKKLAKAVSDAAMYQKREQFKYKAKRMGGNIVFVDRWFPSSKLCYHCNWINVNLKIGDKQWDCPECGAVNKRDENAANNLNKEGLRIFYHILNGHTGGATEIHACGDTIPIGESAQAAQP